MTVQKYMEYYEETESWARLAGIQYKISAHAVSGRSLLTTWKMTYDQVAQENAAASGLLRLWSFLDHGKLWFELCDGSKLQPVDFVWPNWYLAIIGDEIAFQESLQVLVSSSLVSISATEVSFTMHPVLHDWSLHYVQESSSKGQLYAMAVCLVARLCSDEQTTDDLSNIDRILPHAKHIASTLR